VTYVQNDTAFYRGTSAESEITVSREQASIAYTGAEVTPPGTNVVLSAHVVQQDDGMHGDLSGVPVRFSVAELLPDGTASPVAPAETASPQAADASGDASLTLALPAGVYQVTTEIADNGRFVSASAVSVIAVEASSPPSQVEISGFVNLPSQSNQQLGSGDSAGVDASTGAGGSGVPKAHIEADITRGSGGALQGTLTIPETAAGTSFEAVSMDWMVEKGNAVYIKATASDASGAGHPMLLIAEKAIDQDSLQPPAQSQEQNQNEEMGQSAGQDQAESPAGAQTPEDNQGQSAPDSNAANGAKRYILTLYVWENSNNYATLLYHFAGLPFQGQLGV
jgi:hypothetical protein